MGTGPLIWHASTTGLTPSTATSGTHMRWLNREREQDEHPVMPPIASGRYRDTGRDDRSLHQVIQPTPLVNTGTTRSVTSHCSGLDGDSRSSGLLSAPVSAAQVHGTCTTRNTKAAMPTNRAPRLRTSGRFCSIAHGRLPQFESPRPYDPTDRHCGRPPHHRLANRSESPTVAVSYVRTRRCRCAQS